jgi:hypothetical protein
MSTIRFTTDIGDDLVIHPPPGVQLAPGRAEVTVIQEVTSQSLAPPKREFPPGVPQVVQDLVRFAEQYKDQISLPSDYAINHDHYLHGAPKWIDLK